MSTDRVRSRIVQCDFKSTYPTKRQAKRAARQAERHLGRMMAYRCPHCNWFHIGHRPHDFNT